VTEIGDPRHQRALVKEFGLRTGVPAPNLGDVIHPVVIVGDTREPDPYTGGFERTAGGSSSLSASVGVFNAIALTVLQPGINVLPKRIIINSTTTVFVAFRAAALLTPVSVVQTYLNVGNYVVIGAGFSNNRNCGAGVFFDNTAVATQASEIFVTLINPSNFVLDLVGMGVVLPSTINTSLVVNCAAANATLAATFLWSERSSPV
jgi:hypothetical protein